MRKMLVAMGLMVAAAASVIACGDDTQSPPTNDPTPVQPAPSTSTSAPAPVPTTAATQEQVTAPKPDAPVFDSIRALPEGIKVTWDPAQCDAIVGERKYALATYTQVFSVDGAAGSYVDASINQISGNATTNFTYRIRCQKDGVFSDYSDEITSAGFSAVLM